MKTDRRYLHWRWNTEGGIQKVFTLDVKYRRYLHSPWNTEGEIQKVFTLKVEYWRYLHRIEWRYLHSPWNTRGIYTGWQGVFTLVKTIRVFTLDVKYRRYLHWIPQGYLHHNAEGIYTPLWNTTKGIYTGFHRGENQNPWWVFLMDFQYKTGR